MSNGYGGGGGGAFNDDAAPTAVLGEYEWTWLDILVNPIGYVTGSGQPFAQQVAEQRKAWGTDLGQQLETILTWAVIIGVGYLLIQLVFLGKEWKEALSP